MLFLQAHEISSGYAHHENIQTIWESIHCGGDRQSPSSCNGYFRIGFVIADRIISKLGFPEDSQLRVEAGILCILNRLLR
ncbi:MAG: hypothetical protein SRB2_03093 [Desulfobacteraceae bacterium Eth-SRB2]|nr:MAG: hypothetical protein SRB2_03093 [Desulfobacteraceae bacterium Eth-SRB2]